MTRAFKEREKRRGWTGTNSIAQPVIGDRIIAIVSHGMEVTFAHPSRIGFIGHGDIETVYRLGDGTHITAPHGAQIIWEESK